jgi:hypothetical protein
VCEIDPEGNREHRSSFFFSKTKERKKQTENGVHGQAELTLTEMRGLALALERQTSASYIPK